MEVSSKPKLERSLHKIAVFLLKIIPMLLALLYIIATIFDSMGYAFSATIINYVAFFLVYSFLYVISYVFSFCFYHRMFLHYIIIVNIIKIIDYYIGIPLDNFKILQLYLIITAISLFIILYAYVKNNKKNSTRNSR